MVLFLSSQDDMSETSLTILFCQSVPRLFSESRLIWQLCANSEAVDRFPSSPPTPTNGNQTSRIWARPKGSEKDHGKEIAIVITHYDSCEGSNVRVEKHCVSCLCYCMVPCT
jgi:hypothetical protein